MVVNKLAQEGWTLPAELGIYAINVIGKTDEIADINNFLYQYYLQDDYRVAQDMIDGILSSKIKDGLKKMTTECWMAFKAKMYAVCATSLLSVIEGILSEFSDDKQDIRMMKVCQKHLDTFPADGSTIAKHVWVSYNKFILIYIIKATLLQRSLILLTDIGYFTEGLISRLKNKIA